MIINYTFVLKNPKAEMSGLSMALRSKGKQIKISLSTWSQELQQFRKNAPGAKADNEVLNRWKVTADETIRKADLENMDLFDIKERILSTIYEGRPIKNRNLFMPYFEHFCYANTTKRQATRQMGYSFRLFQKFIGRRKPTFDDINNRLIENYIEWMADRGLSANTRGCHVKRIKTAMHEAYDNGLHHSEEFKKFRKETEESDSIYLDDNEIRSIESLNLKGGLDLARDLFVIGCHTALRYSDYSTLQPQDIVNGYIRLLQKKTGEYVIIPAHPKVIEILEKWNGVPRLSLPEFNRNIKEVCRLAGINKVIPIRMPGEDKISYHEKWELVSSHTARRSAATNMYLAGIPPIAIMKITGHKTETTFMRYIKVSKDENAKFLVDHPFFKK